MATNITFINGNYINGLVNTAINAILTNYDYFFLKSMHELNAAEGADIIIAGSSHAMNGVCEEVIENLTGKRFISFSVNSQDLYYDFANIRHAIIHGARTIKTVLVNFGYYMIGQDVSLASNVGRTVVPQIYIPLFSAAHNYDEPDESYDILQNMSFDRNTYPDELVRVMTNTLARRYFHRQKTYYGELMARTELNGVARQGIVWSKLASAQKMSIASQRTAGHNKFIHYEHSIKENRMEVKYQIVYSRKCFMAEKRRIKPLTKYDAEHVKAVRKNTGLSQSLFALALGVTPMTVCIKLRQS